jgi:hypothetical protein
MRQLLDQGMSLMHHAEAMTTHCRKVAKSVVLRGTALHPPGDSAMHGHTSTGDIPAASSADRNRSASGAW